jgi:hypothetical protein
VYPPPALRELLLTVVVTGFATTVTVIPELFPSLVAVIVAVPGDTVVIKPVVPTMATPELDELQVIVRPTSVLSCAPKVDAVNCNVSGNDSSALLGETVTETTCSVTAIASESDPPHPLRLESELTQRSARTRWQFETPALGARDMLSMMCGIKKFQGGESCFAAAVEQSALLSQGENVRSATDACQRRLSVAFAG